MNEYNETLINDSKSETETSNEEKIPSTYADRTLMVAVILFAIYLLFCIFRAGIWNLIIKILAGLIFVGLFATTENTFLKIFWGICCIGSICRIIFAIFGGPGLIFTIIYIVLVVVAYFIASKFDEKKENRNANNLN